MQSPARLFRTLSATILLFLGASASAAVIDFEVGFKFADGIGSSFDVGDYRFSLTGGQAATMLVSSQSDIVEGGTSKLFATNHSEVTMSRIDGGLFDLLSFDLGGSFVNLPSRWASLVTATTTAGSASATPSGPTYTNVTADLFGIDAVSFIPTINASGGINNFEFTLDNIVVREAQAVPAPALAGLFLLAIGLLARRR